MAGRDKALEALARPGTDAARSDFLRGAIHAFGVALYLPREALVQYNRLREPLVNPAGDEIRSEPDVAPIPDLAEELQ